ncbi:MAG: YihA family ribosome biogenesis GTP-binding protein [Gemmatimonadetes bacterium]|nr:MAG: YihA family ribosome biogenesis GTP-binding protein [Gemmatimonadota bacterium]
MKIGSVEYVCSVPDPSVPVPAEGLPHVAFSGRSNVGKSSLINTLLRRTRNKIAHVSGRPGKTRALNFYRVNERFFLVDLPGYGYAAVSRAARRQWKTLVEDYLRNQQALKGVVHLVDARHEPTKDDLQMMEFLADTGLPTLVVLTKIDKIGRGRRRAVVAAAAEALGLDAEQLLPFSSKTGEGRDELLGALSELLDLEDGDIGGTASTGGGRQ